MSENVKNQLGYAPCKFTGKSDSWVNHIHPDDAPHILKNLVDLVEKGRHTHEYRLLHKDGTYRWMYDQLRVVYDSDGEATDVVGNWNHEPRRSGLFICPDTPATPSPTRRCRKGCGLDPETVYPGGPGDPGAGSTGQKTRLNISRQGLLSTASTRIGRTVMRRERRDGLDKTLWQNLGSACHSDSGD